MKTLLFITFFLVSSVSFAQTAATDQNSALNDLKNSRRFISVNGYAEKEVSPDIIYISITIKEYFTDNSQKQKVAMDDLEKDFLRTVYAAGINSTDVSIESISGYGNWGPRKKGEIFLASKRYQLKLTDLDKVNNLMSKVDPKAVSSMYVSGYDYSRMEEVKKNLRIEAMKNARIRAAYMMAALNQSIGTVLEAEEQDSEQNASPFMGRMMGMAVMDKQAPDLDFKKLKITSTVKIKFQIMDIR